VVDIIAHRSHHPYAVMGLERSLVGMRGGYALLAGALQGGGLELEPLALDRNNAGLPSALGGVLPAGSAFAPHRGIDLFGPVSGRWAVLALHGDASFDAVRVAAGVAHDARAKGLELVPVHVETP